MNLFHKHSYSENSLYAIIWLIVFMAPLMGYVFLSKDSYVFNWSDILRLWTSLLPFFLIFILNNYLLIPYFLNKKRYTLYGILLIIAISLTFLFRSFPTPLPMRNHEVTSKIHQQQYEKEWEKIKTQLPEQEWDSIFSSKPDSIPFFNSKDFPDFPPPPPLLFILFIHFALNILIVGFNIAIKLLFKSWRDEKTMRELEHHTLQTELEYLKYQINPHFFMNTLNNIHALMDIDQEKAKKSLIELSKMMRHILYESGQKNITLNQEIKFLTNYIELMKIRYTNKILIECYFPFIVPDIQIPPLLFITFLENAFKHGISYREYSFVRLSIEAEEDMIIFKCENSMREKEQNNKPGIGLQNVRKRLKLLYNTNYTLSIRETSDIYEVLLIIPVL